MPGNKDGSLLDVSSGFLVLEWCGRNLHKHTSENECYQNIVEGDHFISKLYSYLFLFTLDLLCL